MTKTLKVKKSPIDFDLIQFQRFKPYRLKSTYDKSIFGMDTETLDGFARLIADNTGRYTEPSDIFDCLQFLTNRKSRSSHNFFFNLRFDVNAIIKYLSRDHLKELHKTNRLELEDYKIFCLPKKVLRIEKNKHTYKFYDVSQFFGGSLEYNARKYLGLEKYITPIDGATLGTSRQYWDDNYDDILKYCINDCKLTAGLGSVLYNKIKDNLQFQPRAFISKAGLTKEYVAKNVDVPDVRKVKKNALKYGFYNYSGGRFEIIKRGNVGPCTLYDINSAYPFHIANLLDITRGKWRWTRDFHESADYGFYLARVITKYNKFSPIPITLSNGTICYPMIEIVTYLSKAELLAYDKYIDYEIIDGWEFFADEYHYPFREYINKVYDLKNNTPEDQRGEYEYSLYKILMNSLYGCFYEKFITADENGETIIQAGKLFNPIYATLITGNTRIDLWKCAIDHIEKVVGFATDSVLFQGNPEITQSPKLGKWLIEKPILADGVILRSGIYRRGDKMKNRGLSKVGRLQTPHGYFDSIFDYIEQKPNLLKYPVKMNRPLTFVECLLHHKKYGVNLINNFVDIEYDIDINRDFKRVWDDDFENGGDLLSRCIDSEPNVIEA